MSESLCKINGCSNPSWAKGYCGKHLQRLRRTNTTDLLHSFQLYGSYRDATERFWERVYKTDNCWFWLAGRDKLGYGTFSDKKHHKAHRYSYELKFGPIPSEQCVLHKCDTPECVNPDHLFIGDRGDNIRDRDSKGRNPKTARMAVSSVQRAVTGED